MAEAKSQKQKGATLSIISNSALIAIKLVAGYATGSVAIISEAAHSFLDLMAAMMAWGAVRVSDAPPDSEHPFGHGKTENFSALFEAILIVAGGVLILREAIQGLTEGRQLPNLKVGLVVMFLSTAINFFISQRLFKIGRESDSEALTADAWHLRTDVYTSLGIFLALAIIEVGRLLAPSLNLAFMDSAVAALVAALIIKTGLTLGWDASKGLVDHSLPPEEIKLIVEHIEEFYPEIKGFRRLRTRRSGPYRHILVDILVDDDMPVGQAHALGKKFALSVRSHYPKTDLTFHLEPVSPHRSPAADLDAQV
ncbi:MAG: cation diffusion facilitator family transporter [Deltaproteobacteria bacterium]|jgi:cation diffusion facilitator family transporter|nr:cation diffusion facilitator family transporter [Deltaproteobacteria bacterium]